MPVPAQPLPPAAPTAVAPATGPAGATPAATPAGYPATIADAFLRACALDVAVRKPGNVSRASPGHGMAAEQFIASAQAAAPAISQAGATVGQRIEAAVDASWQAAGCNTNLGIVLLCAPLAAAAEACPPPRHRAGLRAAVAAVLAGLDRSDASRAFRAITQANPGGLGQAPAHDVHRPAEVTLGQAMAAAADRDSIARQYGIGMADLFNTGLAALDGLSDRTSAAAVHRVYLGFLAGWPDSHIVRKHGAALAHSVMTAAQPWAARAQAGEALDSDPAFAAWDDALKRQAINPGTSADLTVATLMLDGLLAPAWHGS